VKSLSTFDICLETLDELSSVDALALFMAEDERPLRGVAGYVDWRLCGALSRILQAKFFSGKTDEWLLLPSNGRVGPARIFALGVGASTQMTSMSVSHALATCAQRLLLAQVRSVALEIPGVGVLQESVRAELFSVRFWPAFRGDKVVLLGDRTLRRHLPSPMVGQAGA